MISVSPLNNVEISTSNFTTIKSLSSIYNYSLYSKNDNKLLIGNIGREPVKIHCVVNLEIIDNLIRITDTHGNIVDYVLYASPNDLIHYTGVGAGLAAVAGLTMSLFYLTKRNT